MSAVFVVQYFAHGWSLWSVCASRAAAERELEKCKAEWPGHDTSITLKEVIQ